MSPTIIVMTDIAEAAVFLHERSKASCDSIHPLSDRVYTSLSPGWRVSWDGAKIKIRRLSPRGNQGKSRLVLTDDLPSKG